MNLKVDLGRVEDIVGKAENAGYQHFLLSLNVFKSLFSKGCENPVSSLG